MVRSERRKIRPSSVLLLPLLLLPPVLSGCSREDEAAAELAALQAEFDAADESLPLKTVDFAPVTRRWCRREYVLPWTKFYVR